MEFDIIELTPEELSNFTSVQMQLLRSAQKNKNTLRENMDRDLRLFKSLLLTDDVFNSSLYAQKRAELEREFDFKTNIHRPWKRHRPQKPPAVRRLRPMPAV